jgi:2-polyprenyl-6-methoxyphenol hydroxylase-like FAD-dependent oxidoreductase
MITIGIVGAGIAGLHLALYLQKQGIPVTLYTDRSAADLRAARLPSTVALMGAVQARDTELGTNDWDRPEQGTHLVRMRVAGDPPLTFAGTPDKPFLFIDMRVYVPRLMDYFAERGGAIVVAPCSADDVGRLAAEHALIVVATGRAGLAAMFPRLPERSPYAEPQRRIFAGLFRGVRFPSPFTMGFNIVPGHGEIFENQFLMQGGYATGLLIEAIPGGPFEPLTHLRYEDDPAAFNAAVLAIVREHAPDTYARVDPATFSLTGPLDTLSGAVVPTARRGFAPLPGGRFAMAVGDTHITHDPLTGQGANAASRAAWLLGELLTARARTGEPFDEAFCADAELRLWESARPAAEWTNAFLQPPPPHAIGLLVAAAQNPAIADTLVTNFNHPDRQWAVFSSPDATAAHIASFGAPQS